MADTAAQKREARRRRILENSENRLKKITGLYSNVDNSDTNNDIVERNVSNLESFPVSSTMTDKSAIKEQEVVSYVESYMESPPPPENVVVTDESLWKHTSGDISSSHFSPVSSLVSQSTCSSICTFCEKARLHIIALAVIVRIILTLPWAGLINESALIPLCTVEFAEWIYTKLHTTEPQNSPSGILSLAVMLSGVAPRKVSHLLATVNIFDRLFKDFCVYFFVFSITHVLLQTFSYS